jgi:hypothetical protein
MITAVEYGRGRHTHLTKHHFKRNTGEAAESSFITIPSTMHCLPQEGSMISLLKNNFERLAVPVLDSSLTCTHMTLDRVLLSNVHEQRIYSDIISDSKCLEIQSTRYVKPKQKM